MESNFTSRAGIQMGQELNRNRKYSPTNIKLEEMLGLQSGPPKLDNETGMPVAGKYMQDGQEQDAAGAAGTLQEEKQERPGQRG